jgi:rubrerythrin
MGNGKAYSIELTRNRSGGKKMQQGKMFKGGTNHYPTQARPAKPPAQPSMKRELLQIIITDHHCCACGFVGEARSAPNKVECPSCKTVNDVWFNGKVPSNHILQTEANVRGNESS